MVDSSVFLSVIVVTYNNFDALREVIFALHGEMKSCSAAEILIVDSSDDGSYEKSRGLGQGMKFLRPSSRLLPGPARNFGAQSARGTHLIFLDGDCVPTGGWLRAYMRHAEEDQRRIVCGAVDIFTPFDADQFAEYIFWKLPENSSIPRGAYHFTITENMMIRKADFLATGGFEGSDSANDAQMDSARRKLGLEIYFEPAARVLHIHKSGWRYHMKKFYRAGQEVYALALVLPDYTVGRWQNRVFPVSFLIRWMLITCRLIRYRPRWVVHYIKALPALWRNLLAFQCGLWVGFFLRIVRIYTHRA